MSSRETIVTTTEELIQAAQNPDIHRIGVRGRLTDVPTVRLLRHVTLYGVDDSASITFKADEDGIQLTADNTVRTLHLEASLKQRVLFNDTSLETFGCLRLKSITAMGQVQIQAFDKLVNGHLEVAGLDIAAADTRLRECRPSAYNVSVEQGAFTLWNRQEDKDVFIRADLSGLSVGRSGAPVLGSGVFVAGHGSSGGRLVISRLETEGVYSDGQIPFGTNDLITGGVFVLEGAHVQVVRNCGPVTTYGVNDMVLDNWGLVDRWIAEDKLTSYGPSAMCFVNFGTIHELKIRGLIEAFGLGARGYNVLSGTVDLAEFDRIVTHGDGAMGILINQRIGRLVVRRGIETYGGVGEALVEGKTVELAAIGLSFWEDGWASEVEIQDGIKTNGAGIEPIEVRGAIENLNVRGGLRASIHDVSICPTT